jgi:hypothetical protein
VAKNALETGILASCCLLMTTMFDPFYSLLLFIILLYILNIVLLIFLLIYIKIICYCSANIYFYTIIFLPC